MEQIHHPDCGIVSFDAIQFNILRSCEVEVSWC
jgi:hypothetical protein